MLIMYHICFEDVRMKRIFTKDMLKVMIEISRGVIQSDLLTNFAVSSE